MSILEVPKNVLDRTGEVCHWLTVKEYGGKNIKGVHMWWCLCRCGKVKLLSSSEAGSAKSCGCGRGSNLLGQRFGKLLVVGRVEKRANNHIVWECLCDCGRTGFPTSGNLTAGHTTSCGCLRAWPDREVALYSNLYSIVKALHKKRDGQAENILTLEEFTELAKQNCTYCDVLPSRDIEDSLSDLVIKVNGIDRVDSAKPYAYSNCVPCCTQCNRAKLDHSLDDFKAWVKRAHNHMFGKNNAQ